MPDLVSYLDTVVAAVFGGSVVGGIAKLYDTYLQQDQQEHDQGLSLNDRLAERLDTVEERLTKAEKTLGETQQQLAQSKATETRLRTAIDMLIQRIDTLIDRLNDHEDIPQSEREELMTPPAIATESGPTEQTDQQASS